MAAAPFAELSTDRRLGAHTWVLFGSRNGAYPDGNSLVVAGRDAVALLDPSLSVQGRPELAGAVDLVVLGHVHEDHVAGLEQFPDQPVHAPEADRIGLRDFEGLLTMYGFAPGELPDFEESLLEDFRYRPRPDAHGYADGAVWDLGGVTIRAQHLPGHTHGHSALVVEPDGVVFLGDIELTGFGPYYGDAWSDLGDFETTLVRCRDLHARHYVTFHHKGVIPDRGEYLELLAAFAAVIPKSEQALLAHLAEPRTLAEIVAHRFVYRPHVTLPFVDHVERRSAEQHLERMVADGRVEEIEPGRYRATGGGAT